MQHHELLAAKETLEKAGWKYNFTIHCHERAQIDLHYSKDGHKFVLNKRTYNTLPI